MLDSHDSIKLTIVSIVFVVAVASNSSSLLMEKYYWVLFLFFIKKLTWYTVTHSGMMRSTRDKHVSFVCDSRPL